MRVRLGKGDTLVSVATLLLTVALVLVTGWAVGFVAGLRVMSEDVAERVVREFANERRAMAGYSDSEWRPMTYREEALWHAGHISFGEHDVLETEHGVMVRRR